MKKNGFKRYNAVLNCEYVDMEVAPNPRPVKSVDDLILDSIFSKDENGWPSSSFAKVLSNKTSDEIRKYIQDNLMTAKSVNHVFNDENVIAEFNKLDPAFIAEVSRNRFESVEQYEQRISSYIEQAQSEAATKARFDKYRKFFELDKKEDK